MNVKENRTLKIHKIPVCHIREFYEPIGEINCLATEQLYAYMINVFN